MDSKLEIDQQVNIDLKNLTRFYHSTNFSDYQSLICLVADYDICCKSEHFKSKGGDSAKSVDDALVSLCIGSDYLNKLITNFECIALKICQYLDWQEFCLACLGTGQDLRKILTKKAAFQIFGGNSKKFFVSTAKERRLLEVENKFTFKMDLNMKRLLEIESVPLLAGEMNQLIHFPHYSIIEKPVTVNAIISSVPTVLWVSFNPKYPIAVVYSGSGSMIFYMYGGEGRRDQGEVIYHQKGQWGSCNLYYPSWNEDGTLFAVATTKHLKISWDLQQRFVGPVNPENQPLFSERTSPKLHFLVFSFKPWAVHEIENLTLMHCQLPTIVCSSNLWVSKKTLLCHYSASDDKYSSLTFDEKNQEVEMKTCFSGMQIKGGLHRENSPICWLKIASKLGLVIFQTPCNEENHSHSIINVYCLKREKMVGSIHFTGHVEASCLTEEESPDENKLYVVFTTSILSIRHLARPALIAISFISSNKLDQCCLFDPKMSKSPHSHLFFQESLTTHKMDFAEIRLSVFSQEAPPDDPDTGFKMLSHGFG